MDSQPRKNHRFEADMAFVVTGGPPRYARHTDKPVQYLAVADTTEQVIGYVWANDEDEAGGVRVRSDASPAAHNEFGVWGDRMRNAKQRGIAPTAALAELIRDSPFSPRSHVVPGSLTEASSIIVVDDLARKKWGLDRVKGGATGAMVGLAIGDALGYPTEFLSLDQMTARYGTWRELELPFTNGVALVTDDTQMALAVGDALVDVTRDAVEPFSAATLEPALRAHFVKWLHSPDNNRAPGQTCLTACAALERGGPWQAASVLGSKGCGANMRVAPVGLVPGLTAEQRAGAAQLQAALTHGHPTALAASDLTAYAVWLLTHNCAPVELLPWLRHYALKSRTTYHSAWLGDLAQRAGATDPSAYIAHGWDECLRALDRVEAALRAPDPDQDPCAVTGAGWIAEEALAAALYCFLLFPDEPVTAVRRAAWSSGDSDSIAALAGAFAGASVGATWPGAWSRGVEYRDQMRVMLAPWDTGDTGHAASPRGGRGARG